MKQLLLSLFVLFTLSSQAQVKPPTIAKLIKLYEDSNMVALNDYAHELGYKGEPYSHNAVGNTYIYDHYGFSSKDSTGKQANYLEYTWGEHYPMFGYRLTDIAYGTNSQAVFDALVNEIRALDVTQEDYGKPLPGNYYYKYKNITINATTNLVDNGSTKYNIRVGGLW